MLMRDVPVDEMVFLEERLDDEIRETFYRRSSANAYRHHGCIQGAVPQHDGACPFESGREAYRPRFIRFNKDGFEYPMVGALPVKPISESRFYKFALN